MNENRELKNVFTIIFGFISALCCLGFLVYGIIFVYKTTVEAVTWSSLLLEVDASATTDYTVGVSTAIKMESATKVHVVSCSGLGQGVRYTVVDNGIISTPENFFHVVFSPLPNGRDKMIDFDLINGSTPVVIIENNSSPKGLYYAIRNGAGSGNCTDNDWNCYLVTSSIFSDHVAFDIYNDQEQGIAFHGNDAGLHFATCSGDCTLDTSVWNFETLTTSSVISYADFEYNSSGIPVIAYFNGTDSNVYYAIRNADGVNGTCYDPDWNCYLVDAGREDSMHDISLDFDLTERIGIVYLSSESGASVMKYAIADGGNSGCSDADNGFTCTTVSTGSGFSDIGWPSLSYIKNNPIFSWAYYPVGIKSEATIKLSYRDSGSWTTEDVQNVSGDSIGPNDLDSIGSSTFLAFRNVQDTNFVNDDVIVLNSATINLNNLPIATAIYPVQSSATAVTVTTTVSDADLDLTSLIVEHSVDGVSWVSSTIGSVSVSYGSASTSTGRIISIDTDTTSTVSLTFAWNVGLDLADIEDSSVYLRIIPDDDGLSQGDIVSSSAFAVDTAKPSPSPGNLTVDYYSTSTASVILGSTSTDTNFLEYKIFNINNAVLGSSSTDSNLGNANFNGSTSTVLTGLSINTFYRIFIKAFDTWGNNSVSEAWTDFVTLVPAPSSLSASSIGPTSVSLEVPAFSPDSDDSNLSGYYFELFDATSTTIENSGWLYQTRTWTPTTVLTPATQYYAIAKYRNLEEVESASTTLSFTTTLNVTVSAVAESDTSVTVSWTGEETEDWKVRSAIHDTVDYTEYDFVSSTQTSYLVEGLLPNQSYDFQIKFGEAGEWLTPSVTAVTHSSVPTNITATSTSNSSITVSWEGNGSDYQVCNLTNDAECASSNWLSSSNTSTVITGLNPNIQYSFKVKAKNISNVETDWSVEPYIQKYTLTTIPVPTVSVNSTAQITLSWTGSGSEYYAENITNSDNSGWITGLNKVFLNLTANTAYNFRVKAKNGEGVETEWSSVVSGTTNADGGGGGGCTDCDVMCSELTLDSFVQANGRSLNFDGNDSIDIIKNHCRDVKITVSAEKEIANYVLAFNFQPIDTSSFVQIRKSSDLLLLDYYQKRNGRISLKYSTNTSIYTTYSLENRAERKSEAEYGSTYLGDCNYVAPYVTEDSIYYDITSYYLGLLMRGYQTDGPGLPDTLYFRLFEQSNTFLWGGVRYGDNELAVNANYYTFAEYCVLNPTDADCDIDLDKDGIVDKNDNCPCIKNTEQGDGDKNGIGDVCDFSLRDSDNDEVYDEIDNCPDTYNPDQEDLDMNLVGDACEGLDDDEIPDEIDNCPLDDNQDQLDSDLDGNGDVCDFCPFDRLNDADGDRVCIGSTYRNYYSSNDNCPLIYNPNQRDSDKDGAGDACDDIDGDGILDDKDNCIFIKNTDQSDYNNNGVGDACENIDRDEDKVYDYYDNCPDIYNPKQRDSDKDGIGDICDSVCDLSKLSCFTNGCPGVRTGGSCSCVDIPNDSCPCEGEECLPKCDKVGQSCTVNSCPGTFNSTCSCVDKPNDNCPCIGDGCIEPCTGPNCPTPPCVGPNCPTPPCTGPNCIDDPGNGGTSTSTIWSTILDLPEDIINFLSEQFTNVAEAVKYVTNLVNEFKNNPVVQSLNKNLAVPVMAAAGVGNMAVAVATTSAMGLAQVFNFLRYIFTQPFLLLRIRKRKTWGTIYNAFTKQPVDLAVIRLIDATTNKVVRSQVTDIKGRYLLVADEGTYKLEISRTGFSGFSEYLQNSSEDNTFGNLYHGKEFTLKEHSFINYNIPLDPENRAASTIQILKEHSKKTLQNLFALLGLIISGISLFITPSTTVSLFFFMHLLFYSTFYHFAHTVLPAAWGMTKDQINNSPLSRVVVRVFDSTYNKLVETGITDSKGRYAILVGPSTYYVTYDKPGYQTKKSPILDYSSNKTQGMGGIINRSEGLERALVTEEVKTDLT